MGDSTLSELEAKRDRLAVLVLKMMEKLHKLEWEQLDKWEQIHLEAKSAKCEDTKEQGNESFRLKTETEEKTTSIKTHQQKLLLNQILKEQASCPISRMLESI